MNDLSFLNRYPFIDCTNPLKIDNFYLRGERNTLGAVIWNIQYTEHPKWVAFRSCFNSVSNTLVIQGNELRKLATAVANELEEPSLEGVKHNVNLIRFCRKLEGIETEEHKKQRHAQLKEKFLSAVKKAKMIGKGLARNPDARILREFAWLEALSSDHRYGFELQKEWLSWQNDNTDLSFDRWRNSKRLIGNSPNQVRYLNAAERRQYEVIIEDGKLMRNGKPFNTSSEASIFSGTGIGIYVVSLDGKLYVGSHDKGKFHHSSFLSGAPIKGAGEVQTDAEGQIIFISPKSGHYDPGKKELLAVLKWLREEKVDLQNIKLCLPCGGEDLYYNNVEQFLFSEGNLLPDGIDQATFERKEGKIIAVHQHSLYGGARNNRDLLKLLKDKEGIDLSTVLFKEDTSWGDVFTYNSLEYLERGNLIPKEWDGGKYIQKNEAKSEIHVLSSPPSPSNENEKIKKHIEILNSFCLKGLDLQNIIFISGQKEPPVNAQVYFERNYPEYMKLREEQLNKQSRG